MGAPRHILLIHSAQCTGGGGGLTVVVELALDLWVVLELQVVLADRNRPHLPRVAGAALCRRLRVRLYHLQIRAIYLIINILYS